MRKLLLMLTIVLMYGLLSGSWALAEEKAADGNSEWDVLLEGPETVPGEPPPGGPGPGRRERPGHRSDGPGMGQWRAGPEEHGERRGGGERAEDSKWRRKGQRDDRGASGREHARRFQQVDPDQLLKFLAEHEPTLAERLEQLKINEPQEYEVKMPLLGRLYGPVMQQMTRNPAMAQISLQKIRLHLKVKSALAKAKAQADPDEAKATKKELRNNVAQLFDLILEQEELRVSEMESRLDKWSELAEKYGKDGAKDDNDVKVKSKEGRRAREDDDKVKSKEGRRHKGKGKARLSAVRKRLTQQQEQLETWRENRKQIVNLRVVELLAGEKRFPWGP